MIYRRKCPLNDPPTHEEQKAAAEDGLTYDFGLSETGAQCWITRHRRLSDDVVKMFVEVEE